MLPVEFLIKLGGLNTFSLGWQGFMTALNAGVALIKTSIAKIEEETNTLVNIAGSLASKMKVGDLSENFKQTHTYAKSLIPTIREVGAATALSEEQSLKMISMFVSMGELIDGSNKKQIEDLKIIGTALVANLGSQMSAKQIEQELGDLRDGTITAASTIGKKLQDITGITGKQLIQLREEGKLVEFMADAFKGYAGAVKELENTYGVQKATLESITSEILKKGMAPIYADIVKSLKEINKLLDEHKSIIVKDIIGGYIEIKRDIQAISKLWDNYGSKVKAAINPLESYKNLIKIYANTDIGQGVIASWKRGVEEIRIIRDEYIGETKTVQEATAVELAKTNDVSKKIAVDAFNYVSTNISQNSAAATKEAEKLSSAYQKILPDLKLTASTLGMSEIEQEFAKIIAKYDEMTAKFGQNKEIQRAQFAELAKVADEGYADLLKKKQDDNIQGLEEQKDSLQDQLSNWREYNTAVSQNYTESVTTMRAEVTKLQQLESAASGQRTSYYGIMSGLLQKNTNEIQAHQQTQSLLEQQRRDAERLSGEEKIKALTAYQQAVANAANEVKAGNVTYITGSDAVRNAAREVNAAQKAIETEYNVMIEAQDRQTASAQASMNNLETTSLNAKTKVKTLTDEIKAIDAAIKTEKKVTINTVGATKNVKDLSDKIKLLLPDNMIKTITIKVNQVATAGVLPAVAAEGVKVTAAAAAELQAAQAEE